MKTILVPLDGSALAEQVLPFVRLLAPLLDARVRLLRVIETVERDDAIREVFPLMYGTGEPPERIRDRVEEAWRQMRESAEGYLLARAANLRGAGLEVDAEVAIGSPAEVILQIAGSANAALIAMATHGYSGIKRWAMGSVTDKVVHATSTPVLVVRGQAQAGAAPTLRRVLVPLDGSAFAWQALPRATEVARRAGAEMILLQAIETHASPDLYYLGRSGADVRQLRDELRRQAQAGLDILAGGLNAEGIAARAVVQIGPAADVIVDQAGEQAADLVVMATHGYSGFKRWTLGSVADKVLHAGTAPLLLVRPQQE